MGFRNGVRTLPLRRTFWYTSRAPWEGAVGVTADMGHARLPPSPLATSRAMLAEVCFHLRLALELIACDFYHDELPQVTQESGGTWRWHSRGVCSTH